MHMRKQYIICGVRRMVHEFSLVITNLDEPSWILMNYMEIQWIKMWFDDNRRRTIFFNTGYEVSGIFQGHHTQFHTVFIQALNTSSLLSYKFYAHPHQYIYICFTRLNYITIKFVFSISSVINRKKCAVFPTFHHKNGPLSNDHTLCNSKIHIKTEET